MRSWISQGTVRGGFPTIHVVSDSLGKTGAEIARAAASAYGNDDPAIEILSEVNDPAILRAKLDEHLEEHRMGVDEKPFVLFYTVVDPDLRDALEKFVSDNEEVLAADLLTFPLHVLHQATGREPLGNPGSLHTVNEHYFQRIEALEFTVKHDDGVLLQDLPKADIVILGVSRTSKTPTSIYLGQQGYKVANVPLVDGIELPKEVYEVERERLFGLITDPSVLVGVRKTRVNSQLGEQSKYSNIDAVTKELNRSLAIMRGLGCVIINTKDRAIEETAQEILRHYNAAFPRRTAS